MNMLSLAGRRRYSCVVATLLLVLLNCFSPLLAQTEQSKHVDLATLEWPPYTGAELDDQGAAAVIAKRAFEAMGYSVSIDVLPWKRAVASVRSGQHDAYFPGYFAEDLRDAFIFSEPMGSGPLGFVQQSESPVAWSSLSDLAEYRVGVVAGYNNTEAFDAAVDAGELVVDAAPSDINNLRKLAADRLDLAVIDRNVLRYLLSTEAEALEAKLNFNDELLAEKELHMVFGRSDRGEMLVKAFNNGLQEIDAAQLIADYIDAL